LVRVSGLRAAERPGRTLILGRCLECAGAVTDCVVSESAGQVGGCVLLTQRLFLFGASRMRSQRPFLEVSHAQPKVQNQEWRRRGAPARARCAAIAGRAAADVAANCRISMSSPELGGQRLPDQSRSVDRGDRRATCLFGSAGRPWALACMMRTSASRLGASRDRQKQRVLAGGSPADGRAGHEQRGGWLPSGGVGGGGWGGGGGRGGGGGGVMNPGQFRSCASTTATYGRDPAGRRAYSLGGRDLE